mmetsp:Transcript_28892/g.85988  ORF Transcript_28892/g.85988 Transcript_28892/m.85988 type:complete len:779 (+) Transcript_28892:5087-7423(+)
MAARARRRPLLHAGLRDSAADARADAAVQLLEHRCRLVHARAAVAHPSRPRRPTARSRPCWRHRRERPPFCGVRGGGHHFDLFRAPLLARRHHQAARLVCREHGHVARERVGTRRLPVLARDVGTARLGWRRVVPAASSAVGVAGQRVPSDRRFGRLRLATAPLPAPERRRGGRPAALQRARHRQEHGAGRGQRDRSEHERAVQPRTPDRVTRPCHPAGRGYAQGGARSRRAVGLVGQGGPVLRGLSARVPRLALPPRIRHAGARHGPAGGAAGGAAIAPPLARRRAARAPGGAQRRKGGVGRRGRARGLADTCRLRLSIVSESGQPHPLVRPRGVHRLSLSRQLDRGGPRRARRGPEDLRTELPLPHHPAAGQVRHQVGGGALGLRLRHRRHVRRAGHLPQARDCRASLPLWHQRHAGLQHRLQREGGRADKVAAGPRLPGEQGVATTGSSRAGEGARHRGGRVRGARGEPGGARHVPGAAAAHRAARRQAVARRLPADGTRPHLGRRRLIRPPVPRRGGEADDARARLVHPPRRGVRARAGQEPPGERTAAGRAGRRAAPRRPERHGRGRRGQGRQGRARRAAAGMRRVRAARGCRGDARVGRAALPHPHQVRRRGGRRPVQDLRRQARALDGGAAGGRGGPPRGLRRVWARRAGRARHVGRVRPPARARPGLHSHVPPQGQGQGALRAPGRGAAQAGGRRPQLPPAAAREDAAAHDLRHGRRPQRGRPRRDHDGGQHQPALRGQARRRMRIGGGGRAEAGAGTRSPAAVPVRSDL